MSSLLGPAPFLDLETRSIMNKAAVFFTTTNAVNNGASLSVGIRHQEPANAMFVQNVDLFHKADWNAPSRMAITYGNFTGGDSELATVINKYLGEAAPEGFEVFVGVTPSGLQIPIYDRTFTGDYTFRGQYFSNNPSSFVVTMTNLFTGNSDMTLQGNMVIAERQG